MPLAAAGVGIDIQRGPFRRQASAMSSGYQHWLAAGKAGFVIQANSGGRQWHTPL